MNARGMMASSEACVWHRFALACFCVTSASFRAEGVRNPYERAAEDFGVSVGNISRWMQASLYVFYPFHMSVASFSIRVGLHETLSSHRALSGEPTAMLCRRPVIPCSVA